VVIGTDCTGSCISTATKRIGEKHKLCIMCKRLKFNCLIFVSFQIQKKQRKKSKNLFEDDALLFGEEEQSPSVDIFGSPPKVNIVNLFLIEELPPLSLSLYCYTGSLTRFIS